MTIIANIIVKIARYRFFITTKSRHVTNDVSVRYENRYILFDVFTLNGIVKPNSSKVFILYLSQPNYLFPLCQFLFIFYILILHLFFLQTTNVLVFSPFISNKSINLNHISPYGIRYMNLLLYYLYDLVHLSTHNMFLASLLKTIVCLV